MTTDSPTDSPTDLITLHDKYVLYNPATDLYLRLTRERLPDNSYAYPIEWTTFKKAYMIRDKYISRIQRTLRHVIDFGRMYTTDGKGSDIALCNNILDMIVKGIIGSVSELLLVPLICHPISEDFEGCNFLLAEPLLKVKV